jgi:Uma2 family endonuclease
MRFTVGHVHALADAGFFDPVDRVELIDGEIYVTPPPGEQHTTVSIRLDAFLRGKVGPERYVTHRRGARHIGAAGGR